ncbi:MAG: hypothetical protein DI533_05165 [Cereibacter sphaeroides]|uniref:DUF2189 domain-containing protein n=1 Tax=Cereibacter sphaeroides TaxID=1063 RepID=A0A2W5SGS2_CERSP|nr:MAG: hypothetical protein DI533_05165 [Cereibacter sphaeroides]
MPKTIGNPLSWTAASVGSVFGHAASVADNFGTHDAAHLPDVRQLTVADLKMALRKGISDMAEFRSDVIFACLIYPVIGFVLAAIALKGNMAHLLFPVLSGFALVGPVASVGLYEMSRRHERGEPVSWFVLADLLRSPRFGSILALGLFLLAVFFVWLMAASMIYDATLGPDVPVSIGALLREAVTTTAGWTMTIIGMAVGFVFAAVVLAVSLVSFPLLLDRDVGLAGAVVTSVRVARRSPTTVALWGLIVAVALAVGSIPMLLGLLVVMPVLGHATWHLYRRAVV